ncbi:cytochrome C oxidase assembly protein [Acidithiobacillus sp. CV18-2]|uniref:Cytochrome C oxidase assembly protein n=1 Tax=Igneacidithiobacillus copahuensis TaxID=2724909 RepID=A0AAE2YQ31_9PROT|nr:cytochrome C oxidase assembly protein [Igneacidithiobacillus copahuensis]MBU2755667.1 cytochrome C oxidase assembly protein [Acidithiobacillus sp. CV18-3]MBU2758237.1 cytochrome C oxidase assembly protein [Acidithiobacillus sp. BN09-2]MBU2777495.1 cytochrome C oxidase assembly protein [Acidithiobacillus sp. CV18-2]MBU2796809.1 cytochrome C oxidase assembly protein [Acidithiobacillus sp. VAN18-2]MBU2800419.1 cytochrome C oxidase assembly protein [Acidithiobacillus sp. VAN18-4]UTV80237.1 cyt
MSSVLENGPAVGGREGIPHAVEPEMTPFVRAIGKFIGLALIAAVLAGVVEGLRSSGGFVDALVQALSTTEVGFAMVLILLGSLVEGFGYGLSLGTKWPYTRNIVVLMLRSDPEAAHRVVATLVGLVALVLAILAPDVNTLSGLGLIVVTALFGMGTLYVLAGKAPSLVHGIHGLLAYGVFLIFLVNLAYPGMNFWTYLGSMGALHALLLAVLLGGMTTGQRGFGKAIGAFVKPQKASQWTVAAHVSAALLLVATLGWMMPAFPVAFYLAVIQVAVGFLLFHSVNLKPKDPGIMVAFHQGMVLSMSLAIVLVWR